MREPGTWQNVLARSREGVADRVGLGLDEGSDEDGDEVSPSLSTSCWHTGVCSHGNKLEPRRKLKYVGIGQERQEGGGDDGAKHST